MKPNQIGPFPLCTRDCEGTLLHDVLFAPLFTGSAGSGQPRHWDADIATQGLWWHVGRFASGIEEFDPIAEARRAVLRTSSPPLRVSAWVGRSATLAGCREGRADGRSELERRAPPRALAGLAVPLEPLRGPPHEGRVDVYDPWADRRSALSADRANVPLPEGRRSLVRRWRRTANARAP